MNSIELLRYFRTRPTIVILEHRLSDARRRKLESLATEIQQYLDSMWMNYLILNGEQK